MNMQDFYTGHAFDAYEFFGAHTYFGGTHFAVWAPSAQHIAVETEAGTFDMHRTQPGVWECDAPGVNAGMVYQYWVRGANGQSVAHCDPYGTAMTLRPDGRSIVADRPQGFDDDQWMQARTKCFDKPLNIYEVHAGSWRQKEDGSWYTYAELAELLRRRLGKIGLVLRAFARGEDRSPVALLETEDAPKSISNSTTPPHDIENAQDARCIYYLLAESVGARLRRKGLRAQVVSVSARTTALETFSCQCAVSPATNLTGEIAEAAMTLFSQRLSKLLPLRSVGLCCTDLTADETPLQIDMLGGAQRRMHTETLERSVDALRDRFGRQVIHRGIVLADREFAQITPAEEQLARPFNMSAAEGGR